MVNIDYGIHDRLIDSTIRKLLMTREHPMGRNAAYPTQETDPENGNYEQILAKKRFNDLVEKYKQVTNNENTELFGFFQYIQEHFMLDGMFITMLVSAHEDPYLKELTELAVDIVRKDFNIKKGNITFNAKIVPIGSVKADENTKKAASKNYAKPEPNIENFKYNPDAEIQKRQFINALMSGASKKGHYIFHLAKDNLDALDPELVRLYQKMMVSNDLSYYILPQKVIDDSLDDIDGNSVLAGTEKITFDENGKPVITIEAINFPVLIHELIKGVIELIATLALPDDTNMLEYIYDQADYMAAEMWYLRLGAGLWEQLIALFPPEYARIKAQLLGKIFEQSTADFNIFMQSVLAKENQFYAKNMIESWGKEITENIRNYNQELM